MNYYNQIASIYDATRPLPMRISTQVADCILGLVAATPLTKFLEPGIGTGRTALPIIQRGYCYTGVDISPEMMDELRHKLGGIPDNLTLIQADASYMPFRDRFFEVVLTTHILHCLPDWQQGLAEIRRVLKPEGCYLACENLQTDHQREFESHLRRLLAEHQAESQEPIATPKSIQQPFGEGLKQVLIAQGATVKTITAARWQVEQTVGQLLSIYQSRALGLCWTVPEPVFLEVMRDFRAWCQQHYGSEEVVLTSEARFDLTVVRNWATGSADVQCLVSGSRQ